MFPAMQAQVYATDRFSQSGPSLESRSSDSTVVQRRNVRSLSTSSLSSGSSSVLATESTDAGRRRSSISAVFSRSPDVSRGSDCSRPVVRLLEVDEDVEDPCTMSDADESAHAPISNERDTTERPNSADNETEGLDWPESPTSKTFGRWLSTLRRRKTHPRPVTTRSQRWTLDDFDTPQTSPVKSQYAGHRRRRSRTSSIAFVTAVKSASITIATASVAPISQRNSATRRAQQHSSLFSGTDVRRSLDLRRPHVDDAAMTRSHRRREKLMELLRTEEGYVSDLKALSSARISLTTLLGHLPNGQPYIRHCAFTTVSALITLHHAVLSQLRHAVPFADVEHSPRRPSRHIRWYSTDGATRDRVIDSVYRPERRSLNLNRSSSGSGEPLRACEPHIVAAVTEIFRSNLPSFVAYDDFGEHYELTRMTVVESQQTLENWSEYDAAFETLAYTLNPLQRRNHNQKRALRVRDLLIKPIQRLPRYLLLFQDLQKLTPVCDDPSTHAGLEDIVEQLEAACERLNRSRRSLDHSRVLDSTWLVSERLSFHNQLPRLAFLKLLGNVELCGCLHIAYRSKEEIKGRYVICILFETTLLLAMADDDINTYNVLAGIALSNVTMAETGNGRGLQCHTAPHSWKLVYEHQTKMYELIFTACSGTEARVWREQISQCAALQAKVAAGSNRGSFELHSPLVEDMRTVGKALGKAGSFVRRMSHESIRRAATVASTTSVSQVIIKNTQACKEALDPSNATLQIPRSQSVATPSHVQTLAPRRVDRVRLEALLSDVWTRDVLPYPGMTPRRSDPIRASANHVMRKFSMASITSNFSTSKRNISHSSMSGARKEDMPPPTTGSGRDRRLNRPQPVSFHTAPDAFLPEDFTVGGTMPRAKRSALRTLTMTLERPFSPAPSESKPAPMRRAQSVRDGNRSGTLPVYTVVQQRANTPAPSATTQGIVGSSETEAKTPRKTRSKSRLLRMFA